MMLEPSIYNLLDHVPSRYMLVNVVAHRAREISSESEKECFPLAEKPVTLALKEVAKGLVKPMEDEAG